MKNKTFVSNFLLMLIFVTAGIVRGLEAKERGRFCTFDESNEEYTSVICRDELSETQHGENIDPLVVHEMSLYLEENGIEILSTEEFLARTLLPSLSASLTQSQFLVEIISVWVEEDLGVFIQCIISVPERGPLLMAKPQPLGQMVCAIPDRLW